MLVAMAGVGAVLRREAAPRGDRASTIVLAHRSAAQAS